MAPAAPADPNAMGAAPMGDPNAMGAAPMGDPNAMGAAPMGDPNAMGAAPMGDPNAMGAEPAIDPSAAEGEPENPRVKIITDLASGLSNDKLDAAEAYIKSLESDASENAPQEQPQMAESVILTKKQLSEVFGISKRNNEKRKEVANKPKRNLNSPFSSPK